MKSRTASRKSSFLSTLKAELKNLLKQYKQIEDIVVFGSFMKEKPEPKDVDLAFVMKEKNYDVLQKADERLGRKFVGIEFHLIIVLFNELYTEPVWKSIISEGFSVRRNKFLKDIVDVTPVEIISFGLKGMTPTEKVQFNRGFNNALKLTGAFRTGAGTVVVPSDKSGLMEDFFRLWKKAKVKVYKAILL